MSSIKSLLEGNNPILIQSGEGEVGTYEAYTGKRTERAIKTRLTREKANGDRWARAWIYLHSNDSVDVYMDFDSGELRHIDDNAGK